MASTVARNTAPSAQLLSHASAKSSRLHREREIHPADDKSVLYQPRSVQCSRASAISISTLRRVGSLRLIVITVIPRHPDTPTNLSQAEERDISIGKAGDVSIGDLQGVVAEGRVRKITALAGAKYAPLR